MPIHRLSYGSLTYGSDTETGEEIAVVMLVGDKATLGNEWYPAVVKKLDDIMVRDWERTHQTHKARVRRSR